MLSEKTLCFSRKLKSKHPDGLQKKKKKKFKIKEEEEFFFFLKILCIERVKGSWN